jgi:hypothetical protein
MPKIQPSEDSMFVKSTYDSYTYMKRKRKKLILKKRGPNGFEYFDKIADEKKLNLTYSEILKRIESGKMDPKQLTTTM